MKMARHSMRPRTHATRPAHSRMRADRGYHVLTWGGGRYTSVAWFATRREAENEVERIKRSGRWSGAPPKIEPAATRQHAREGDDNDDYAKPLVVAVSKSVWHSSGRGYMDYEHFARARGADLKDVFRRDELTVDQAIQKLVEMGWEPDEFREIEESRLDEDEKLDMLVEWADEHGKADNTYNWSWWGPTLRFVGVQAPDESGDPWQPEVYFVRAHLGGDVRGNYSGDRIFYLANPGEDAPWYAWNLTATLTMADGSTVLLDADGTEGSVWTVVEDPTGTFRAEVETVREHDLEREFDWEDGVSLY